MKQRRNNQEKAVLLLSLPRSSNRFWESRCPFLLEEISSLFCNASFIGGIYPKSLFKGGGRQSWNKTLEKSHWLYSFSCCSNEAVPSLLSKNSFLFWPLCLCQKWQIKSCLEKESWCLQAKKHSIQSQDCTKKKEGKPTAYFAFLKTCT